MRAAQDAREEIAKLEKLRAEITHFQSGQGAAELRQQKQIAAELAIEIENLRLERTQIAGGGGARDEDDGEENGTMMMMVEEAAAAGGSQAAPSSSAQKRPKRSGAAGGASDHGIFPSPDGTVILRCRCGHFVPITAFNEHVHREHATASKRALLCAAGCGVFIVNRPIADLEKHRRTGECARRVEAIRRLMGGAAGC